MIAAVVVTYSAPAEVLDRCLRALLDDVDDVGPGHVVVVDTGGAAVVADELARHVELVQSDNRGYGAAANLGVACARVAGADRFVLLNDDAVVRPGWLAPLIAALDPDARIGVVQPMIVDGAGERVVSLGVALDRFGAGHDVGDGSPLPTPSTVTDLEIFNGGAVAFCDEFLVATGGFDERLFLYYEDVDLALWGAGLGWRYRLVTDSMVSHDRGTSTSRLGEQTRFFQERNRMWIAWRYGDARRIASALWLSVRRLRHPPRRVHARALLHGALGPFRRRRAAATNDQPL